MSVYRVESAKSGRSTCKGKCKAKIDQGALRFGSGKEAAWDGIQFYWRCSACMTTKVLDNMLASVAKLDDLDGFNELSGEQQEEVERLFDERSSAAGGADGEKKNDKPEPSPKKSAVSGGVQKKKKTKATKATKGKVPEPEHDVSQAPPLCVD